MPVIHALAELNSRLAGYDAADDARRIAHRTNTVGTDFAFERQALRPLPGEAFETGLTLTPRVDRHARISVRQSYYSVPARLIGGRVRTLLRAEEVLVYDGKTLVARHERARTRGGQVLNLDHYLEVLARKPGALPAAMALSQARAAKVFTPAHDAFWAAARTAHGDAGGTRTLIEVLLLHRYLPSAAVLAGIRAALTVGTTSAEVVALEARRALARDQTGGQVILLPMHSTAPHDQPAQAAGDDALADTPITLPGERPLPSVAHYDELLTRRARATAPETG